MKISLIILLLAASYQLEVMADTQPSSPVIGDNAPLVTFTRTDGSIENIENMVNSKKYVLIFSSTESSEDVLNLQPRLLELASKGIPTVIVDVDCFLSREQAKEYWEQLGLMLPVRYDAGALSSLYKISGIPFAIIVDEARILRFYGGLGVNRHEHEKFFEAVSSVNYHTGHNLTELPIANENLSHFPHCRGSRK